MRILLTGADGLLGRSIQNCEREVDVIALGHRDLDIASEESVDAALRTHRPDWVINCAAATDVDRCERDVPWACAANARGPRLLAEACAQRCRLIHISTDFVFGGEKNTPYVESDPPHPLSVYGASKRLGECAVLAHGGVVARTQWLYGAQKSGFVDWVLTCAPPVRAIEDSIGCPTNAADLAACLLDLCASEAHGLYHIANSGACSRADFAEAILVRAGTPKPIERTAMRELQLPARRPRYSALASERGLALRPWEEALDAYFAERQ